MGGCDREDDENVFWRSGLWKFEVFFEGSLRFLDDHSFAFLNCWSFERVGTLTNCLVTTA